MDVVDNFIIFVNSYLKDKSQLGVVFKASG